jgi:hypothetical protein
MFVVARLVRLGLISILLAGIGVTAEAQDGGFKRSQFYRGVVFHHKVTHVTEGDVNSDGSNEVLICYREPGDAVNQQGGVLVLTKDFGSYSVAWHAIFETVYPKKVTVAGSTLTFELVQTTMQADKTVTKSFVLGKDFHFRGEEGNPLSKVKISASSTLKKDGVSKENIFDRNLKTAWAEGAEGTGVDETITFEFSEPVHLGLIGMLHGNYEGRREWRDNNRVHRAEVTVETSSDRYDVESEVDFEADLGLGMYGDRVEMSFSNKPVMRYFKLGKKAVLSVELKITSVLLGEKNDDAYIAEVDFAELITAGRIFGTEKPRKKKPVKKEEKEEEDDEGDDWEEDEGF